MNREEVVEGLREKFHEAVAGNGSANQPTQSFLNIGLPVTLHSFAPSGSINGLSTVRYRGSPLMTAQ